MTITLCKDKILINPVEETKDSIIFCPARNVSCMFADVISVGPLVERVKSGDTVIFCKHAGINVKQDGQDMRIVSVMDILAVVERG